MESDNSSRAAHLANNTLATKRTSPEKVADDAERVAKRPKAAAQAAEEVRDPAPLDPLLVSRFAGARHQRKDVEAILRRFPALCRRDFFVIQEHHATAKHFDLRLQLDDELLSWAIPRGFSLNKEEQALGKTEARLAVETTPHYFSEAIREGQVMVRTCAALWDVGFYEIDTYHSEGDLDAADTTPDSSDDESWPAADVSQEDKFRRVAFHYCRWLDLPPSKMSAGIPENGPTGGQRKFSVILHGERFKNLRLTFFRKMLDSYHSKSKHPLLPDIRTRWFLYVPPPLDDDDVDKAARKATTSILTGRTMKDIRKAEKGKWADLLADFHKRTRKTYQEITGGKSSRTSDLLECPEALEAFAAAGEF